MPPHDIRPGREADFEALSVVAAAAYAHAYADYWEQPSQLSRWLLKFTATALRSWAEEADVRLRVAYEDGAPVGYLGLRLRSFHPATDDPAAAEVERLYVLPNAERRGLGRALLACAEADARAGGASAIWLKSMADAPVRDLYLRWGFRRVGEDHIAGAVPARAAMVVLRKEIGA